MALLPAHWRWRWVLFVGVLAATPTPRPLPSPCRSPQWKCDATGVTENLWLNLSTGFIGSGRQVGGWVG